VTHLEIELLLAFLRQPNRVLARSWLLQTVWRSAPTMDTRTVDKHVQSLRKKLPPFGKKVETVVGMGYLFRPGGSPALRARDRRRGLEETVMKDALFRRAAPAGDERELGSRGQSAMRCAKHQRQQPLSGRALTSLRRISR